MVFRSSPISFVLPKGRMKTMRGWLEHSLEYIRLAAKLLDRSTVLRNNITALFSKVMHDFDTKIHATDFAYRKRYHDTLQAARRLEHNRQNVMTELKAVENDIHATEKGHEDVLPWKKLCHTRLENRNQRPNNELSMDIAQEGLLLEASNHRHSREGLFQKITELRSRWNDLSEQLHRVELDLDRKQKCLEMDKRAVDLRQGTFLPEAEKDVIDWVVDRGTKVFSMDPDQRYKKHLPKVLV
ncbi:hypothetical protein RvY_13991 [Ramazzottius varieornatus]|uniref:Tektin n=1 Tax=Ramazzottius varieornatus TaxID=947166 RepID=A0A1D1VPV5_RAMVA|nr:hypothetical protein RvY_13991 [Ramazzottius varieornatus]